MAGPSGPQARGSWPGETETMNPLLFADWGRMNRLFTRVMWGVVLILVCVMFVAVTQSRGNSHRMTAPAIRSAHTAPAAPSPRTTGRGPGN